MRVTIPIYVRQYRPPKSPAMRFLARPLFAPLPERHGTVLSRVLAKLSGDLRRVVDVAAREARQRELADWTFNPVAERQFLNLSIPLRRRTVKADVLVVTFRSGDASGGADGHPPDRASGHGARLGFFPELPDVWFDLRAGAALADRAEEVLADHLQRLER